MKKLITLIIVAILMMALAATANAAFGIVVEAQKVEQQPNLEEIDESWGEPVLTNITSASDNTWLWKFWNEECHWAYYNTGTVGPIERMDIEPEDLPIDLYLCWDEEYFYFGIIAEDHNICGAANRHRGDGVQLQFQPIESVEDPTFGANENVHSYDIYNYLWTLSFDDWSTDTEFYTADLEIPPYINASFEDCFHATIAIPFSALGYHKKNPPTDGLEFAIAFLRVSSISSMDEGYAGGLCWGKYLRDVFTQPTNNFWGPTTSSYSMNTVVLRDPSVEAPVTEAPATEAPATEAPATEAPATEAPATEAPATEAPATEAPKTDAPATEAPATEAPATEAPATEAPATEAPATDAPATEAPVTEAPVTEAPETEAPATEAPATESPATEAPATEAPATEAPATEAPATEAPATEAPKAEEPTPDPAEKSNTGLIIAIVAVVVVIGGGLGIILGKKKK